MFCHLHQFHIVRQKISEKLDPLLTVSHPPSRQRAKPGRREQRLGAGEADRSPLPSRENLLEGTGAGTSKFLFLNYFTKKF